MYRVDWIDSFTGDKCMDILTERAVLWELDNDFMEEIYSVTEILDDEGNESENLIEIFRTRLLDEIV